MDSLLLWDKLFDSKENPCDHVNKHENSSSSSECIVHSLGVFGKSKTFAHWPLDLKSSFFVLEEFLRKSHIIVLDAEAHLVSVLVFGGIIEVRVAQLIVETLDHAVSNGVVTVDQQILVLVVLRVNQVVLSKHLNFREVVAHSANDAIRFEGEATSLAVQSYFFRDYGLESRSVISNESGHSKLVYDLSSDVRVIPNVSTARCDNV